MQMNRLILGTTSAALLCGAAVAGTAVTSAAATPNGQPGALTQQSATNSDYSITGATTFISINHSGEVILQAPNSDEYTMTGCSARLTSSGAQFSNCTGEGASAFFGGQTLRRTDRPTRDSWSCRPLMARRLPRRSRQSTSRCRVHGVGACSTPIRRPRRSHAPVGQRRSRNAVQIYLWCRCLLTAAPR